MFILLCVLFLSTTFNTTIIATPEETTKLNQTDEITDLTTKIADLEKKLSDLKDLEKTPNFEITPKEINNLHAQAKDLLQKNLPVPLYKKVYTSIRNFASTIKSYVTVGTTFRALILLAESYAVYYFLLQPNEADPKKLDPNPNQTSQNPAFTEVMSEFLGCLFSFSRGTCNTPAEIYVQLKKEKANMSN